MSCPSNNSNDGLSREERMLRLIAESLVNEALGDNNGNNTATNENTARATAATRKAARPDTSRHSVVEVRDRDEAERPGGMDQ